jgi:hypothetical protein
MGRNADRQTAKFNFGTYKIEMYRPTQGQGAAITISGKQSETGKDPGSLVRFFRVIESLVVNRENWEAMEDAMITGDIDLDVFMKLAQDVFQFDWDSADAQRKQLAEKMSEKTSDSDDA